MLCFTICLCITVSLDSDRLHQSPITNHQSREPASACELRNKSSKAMICFTICLFISPDLDGNRGKPRHGERQKRDQKSDPFLFPNHISAFGKAEQSLEATNSGNTRIFVEGVTSGGRRKESYGAL
jgi:hypothetical protein